MLVDSNSDSTLNSSSINSCLTSFSKNFIFLVSNGSNNKDEWNTTNWRHVSAKWTSARKKQISCCFTAKSIAVSGICNTFSKDVFNGLVKLILRTCLNWSNFMLPENSIFLRFLSASLEKTAILDLDKTSFLNFCLDQKLSLQVVTRKYKQHYYFSNVFSGKSSLFVYVYYPIGFLI